MLKDDLNNLYDEIIKNIDKKEMQLSKEKIKSLEIVKVEYRESKIIRIESREIELLEVNSESKLYFFNDTVNKIAIYQDIINYLQKEFKFNVYQAKEALRQLTFYILENHFNKEIYLSKNKIVSLFILDLETKNKITYKITGSLEGIFIKEEIKTRFFSLRKQVENDILKDNKLFIYSNEMQKKNPSVMLEFFYESSNINEAQKKYRAFLDILRLYKTSSLYFVQCIYEPISILKRCQVEQTRKNMFPVFKNFFLREDINKFEKFYQFTSKKLEYIEIENSPLKYSLKNFAECISLNMPNEERIAKIISVLESLLCNSNERNNKKELLKTRGGVVISLFNIKSNTVKNDIHVGYSIRSNYFHGSITNSDKNTIEFCKTLVNYTRLVLVLFIQLFQVCDKIDLINLIDNIKNDNNKRKILKKLVNQNTYICK